jgi:hypothetical protein
MTDLTPIDTVAQLDLRYTPLDTDLVRALQAGGPDAYGQTPQSAVSDGDGVPCRHCLRQVPAGRRFLILAHRPFPEAQPYAETGPIFLCADACAAPTGATGVVPEILRSSPTFLMRGYSVDHRIVYGTGAVVPSPELEDRARALLSRADVAYLHVRSARNNCYQLRIDRA